jgi:hypothetical protein
VEIVENLAGSIEAAATWRLAPAPEVSIGVPAGAEELQLFRVADAATVGDQIVVANAGTRELRWFDPTGAFLGATGRAGEGPGEFGVPTRLWSRADGGITVWDPRLRRLSFFGPDRSFQRMVVPNPPGSSTEPDLVALFADGSFVLADWLISMPDEGFAESVLELSLHTLAGERVRDVASLPSVRMGHFESLSRAGRVLFDANAHAAGGASALWAGNGGQSEVTRYDSQGRPTRIIRWPAERREIEPHHIDAHFQTRIENDPEDADLVDEIRRVQPVAGHFPEFEGLVAAETGELWVMRYRPPAEQGGAAWLVFDDVGVLVATAATPAGFAPFEIGSDYVLGAALDDAGVERVVMYRLLR